MKKNFLMVASLLIAAMLLVVSCSQEAKAPESSLVEVKLGVGYGRDLTVDGATSTENMKLKYTMTHAWTNPTGTAETIVGDKEDQTEFVDGSPIGYVTPGLWKIHVYAYEANSGDNAKPIFDGEAQAYFSDKNNKVTVYLAPTSDQTNTIRFAVSMQDLVGEVDGAYKGKGSYRLKYSLYKTNGSETTDEEIEKVSGTNLLPDDITMSILPNTTNYYASKSGLESGYYRATVKVFSVDENDNETLVGGISKGFLLSGDDIVTITGHIEPSKYINFAINAVLVKVNTSLSVAGATTDGTDGIKVKFDAATGKNKVTVTWNDTTNVTPNTKDIYWSLNGKSDSQQNIANTTTSTTKDFEFTAPGYNYVTATTVYKVLAPTTGDADAEYFFADTQTIRIFVEP